MVHLYMICSSMIIMLSIVVIMLEQIKTSDAHY
ncbi:hypothetical protein BHAP_1749 [Bifidobacterium hapali]|uniref:Uncharacterized protein n=1 Tax=Bifidobacterium hapali TaxID=1630172 RepID=A0A261FXI3_9BIFI|nr:hypothetical protein BHAP_1749 [Bifidobacterium hapali]